MPRPGKNSYEEQVKYIFFYLNIYYNLLFIIFIY